MEKILVPVDGSEQATLAASWAAKLAQRTGGELTLLHVYVIASAEAIGLANQSKDEIKDVQERRAAEVFDKTKNAMGEAGKAIDTTVVIGDPAEEIIGLAKSEGYDHIVMGNRGMSPVEELLLGSVSEKVIREAHCAVTIIH